MAMATRTRKNHASSSGVDGSRLGDVLTSLAVIDVVTAPLGLDVVVTQPVIHDPASPPHLEPGAIVLGVGVDATTADELLARAGSASAAAVILKLSMDSPDALRA